MDDYKEWKSLSEEEAVEEFQYRNPEFPQFNREAFEKFYVSAIKQTEEVIVQTAGPSYDEKSLNEARNKLIELSSESDELSEKRYKLRFIDEDVEGLAEFMSKIGEWKAQIPWKIEAKIQRKVLC